MKCFVDFFVPGKAVAQARPRTSTKGGRVRIYDSATSVEYKSKVAFFASQAMLKNHCHITDGGSAGIEVELVCYMQIPHSYSKAKIAEIKEGTLRPTVKPDVDNLAKSVMDALTGVVWEDDRQVTTLSIRKEYAVYNEPGIDVIIRL